MSNKTPLIVFDTNVLISAGLLPNSVSAKALTVAVGQFLIAQNESTWHELETRIVRPKFDQYFGEQGRLKHLAEIAKSIAYIPQQAHEVASVDATDDKFLSLAVDAKATLIVSGDDDLLALSHYKGIEIITPSLFVASYFKDPK